MSVGLYVHITRAPGTIVTADLYNGAHRNHLDNDIPASCGAHSDDLAMFQATTDPYPLAVATPVAALGDELEQLRFVVADIKGTIAGTPPAFWYSPATGSLTNANYHTHGASVTKGTQIIGLKTSTPIIFDTVNYDSGVVLPTFDPFWSSGHPTRLTAPVDGLYQFTATVAWSAGITAANIAVFIRVNGSKLLAAQEWPILGTSAVRYQSLGSQYVLHANDYVELVVFHTAVSTMAVTGSTLTITLIAPLQAVPAQTIYTLSVTESGSGTGVVTSTPGNIISPGVNSDQYVSGSNVSLAAAADGGSNFVQWTGVPVGHETDNPVSVPMTANKTVDAQFDTTGSPFAWPAFLGDSIDDGGGTVAFSSFGWNGNWNATIGAASMKILKATTITSWTAQMSAALAGTSILFEIMVNGVADATMPITVTTGQDGARSTDGSLVLNPGDIVAIRGTASGGAETEIVNGFVFAYTSASPFYAHSAFPSASPYKLAFGGSSGAGQATPNFSSLSAFEASLNPMTVNQVYDMLSAKLAAATSGTLQPRLGAVNTGPSLAIVAADNASGAIALTVPQTATVADLGDFTATSLSGTILRTMATYAVDSPFASWCIIPSGISFSQTLGTNAGNATDVYGMGSNLGKAVASEAQVQLRWPNLPGTFQHMVSVAIMPAIPGSTTVEFGVRINGASTPFTTATASVAPFVLNDAAANPHVNTDDLVNFYGHVTPQSGTRATKTLFAVGFLAD